MFSFLVSLSNMLNKASGFEWSEMPYEPQCNGDVKYMPTPLHWNSVPDLYKDRLPTQQSLNWLVIWVAWCVSKLAQAATHHLHIRDIWYAIKMWAEFATYIQVWNLPVTAYHCHTWGGDFIRSLSALLALCAVKLPVCSFTAQWASNASMFTVHQVTYPYRLLVMEKQPVASTYRERVVQSFNVVCRKASNQVTSQHRGAVMPSF